MQVDQTLEGLLFAAGEEPVDGPVLVALQVVLEEAVAEVAADGVAARLIVSGREVVGQEGEVGFQVALVPGHAHKLDQAVGGIVVKPLGIGEREQAVVVGGEGGVAAWIEAHVAAVGVDQARLVQAVAAHHAADGVGDQLLHGVLAEAGP